MTILLVQIFAVLLAAFLLGVAVAWWLRGKSRGKPHATPTIGPAGGASLPSPESTTRFERALSGGPAAAATSPPRIQGQPMVEVQPRPAVPHAQTATPKSAPPPSQGASALHSAPAASRFGTPTIAETAAPKPTTPPQASAAPSPVPAAKVVVPPASPPASAPPVAATPSVASAPLTSPRVLPAEPVPSAAAPAAAPTVNPPPAVREIAGMSLAVAAAVAAATASGTPIAGDDLTRIRAIDADTAKRLRTQGVLKFSDIARWTPGDVARISQSLGFAGRVERENWIEQASILAKGGEAAIKPRAADAPAASAAPPPPGADRLHRIIGLDARTEQLLIGQGVTRFADIARWAWSDVEKVEAVLGQPGRVGLENWIGQAKILAQGAGGNVTLLRPVEAKVDAPAKPSAPLQAAPVPSAASQPAAVQRGDFAGLRSVRSEALRGEPLRAGPAGGQFDDLKRIRGVGVLIEKKLNSLGVASYEQIANWTRADIDRINQILDFKGRIERENWVEQARILCSGGYTEFSRRADRGEVETSRSRA
jgi:predicted flap endonuclease-1-like 5' DNA nuclease